MGRQFMKYGAGLIAFYLAVANASGLGKVFTDGANGGATVVKALQGRK
jgi:hypothetical protein